MQKDRDVPRWCDAALPTVRAAMRAAASLLLALALVTACRREPVSLPAAPAATAATFSFAERVGWIHGRCLAIANHTLARGAPVAVIITDEPQRVQPARLGGRTTDASVCPALLEGRAGINAKSEISFYRLEAEALGPRDIGIAIIDPPAMPTVVNGLARLALDPTGEHVFSSCTTSEGIKYAVWSGQANRGEPRWSGYNYLGYDVTRTCP
jgi:hypothetical protein